MTLRKTDRILALLLAVGVLAAVFGLRACRNTRAQPAEPAPVEAPVRETS